MSIAGSQPQIGAEPRGGLLLGGLDGANPLGFLAALGLFRFLDECYGSGLLHMSWAPWGGTWVPVLHPAPGLALQEEMLLSTLREQLVNAIDDHPAKILS